MRNFIRSINRFFFVLLFFAPLLCFSQQKSNNGKGNGNASGQEKWDNWSLTGNEGKSGDKLGTTNNQPVTIVTKDSVRMEIKPNGDIGVAKNIEVNGSVKANAVQLYDGTRLGDSIFTKPMYFR